MLLELVICLKVYRLVLPKVLPRFHMSRGSFVFGNGLGTTKAHAAVFKPVKAL